MDNFQVNGMSGEGSPATPPDGLVESPNVASTQNPTPSDAELKLQETLALVEKLNKDVNNVKSTFQRREAQLSKQWEEERAQLFTELEQYKLSTLDEEGRKQYEEELRNQQLRQYEQELQKYKQKDAEWSQVQQAVEFFRTRGIDASTLPISEGYAAVFEAGMERVFSELELSLIHI